MAHQTQNFSIHRGEIKVVQVDVTESDGTTPKNLTSIDDVIWKLTTSPSSTVALAEKRTTLSGDDDITLSDGAGTNDRATFTLVEIDTIDLLHEGLYWHEMRLDDGTTENSLVMSGALTIDPSVTA